MQTNDPRATVRRAVPAMGMVVVYVAALALAAALIAVVMDVLV